MNIGIAFGCFIPLHDGHMSMINKSIKENDFTVIGVCGYDDDRGKDFIPFRKRYQLIQEIYGLNKQIIVVLIDDKKLGLDGTFTMDNWKLWCNEIFQSTHINPQSKINSITWYSGEESYLSKISKLYPSHKYTLLNRENINISGTEIRQNPKIYEELINPVFREYLYEQNIL